MADLESDPLIVYGAARSGTTYLIQILNNHPEVHITNEVRLFAWAHRALRTLTADNALLYRHRGEFEQHLLAELPALIRTFYGKQDPTARVWGDKNPHYVSPENEGCLDTILELFPGTRFIHILRDGRDVVASGLRGAWPDFQDVHNMWSSHVQQGRAFGRTVPENQYFELRYEDLVRDDLAMARELFSFLGLDLRPQVVRFCETQREKRTPFCEPSRDLSRSVSASEWATALTGAQCLASLDLIGSDLVRYGYETNASLQATREEILDGLRIYDFIREQAAAVLPEGAIVAVVSKGDAQLLSLGGREGWHFPQEADGTYAGYHPADAAEAIRHLEALRVRGVEYVLVPAPSFWWEASYPEFFKHLDAHGQKLARHESCLIYALGEAANPKL